MPQPSFRPDQFIAAGDFKKISQEWLLEKLEKEGQLGVIFNNLPKVAMLEMETFVNLLKYVEQLERRLAEQIELEEDEELERQFAYRTDLPEDEWVAIHDGDDLLRHYQARKEKHSP